MTHLGRWREGRSSIASPATKRLRSNKRDKNSDVLASGRVFCHPILDHSDRNTLEWRDNLERRAGREAFLGRTLFACPLDYHCRRGIPYAEIRLTVVTVPAN